MSASRSEAKIGKFMARWELSGSRNRFFFSTASRELLFSRSFEPLFVCDPDLGMVENVCYILCNARFGQSSNVLDDHGFDSGFMIAMYSFVPMGFQAWIDFIRGMLVIDWCLFHSPRPNHRFAAPCRVRLELVNLVEQSKGILKSHSVKDHNCTHPHSLISRSIKTVPPV